MPGVSSQGRGELRRSDALWWLRPCWFVGLVAAPFLMSGCAVSKFSNPFGAGSPDTSASAVTEDRLMQTAKADSGEFCPACQGVNLKKVTRKQITDS